jgi:histone-lysine N-methyltransferase SETMAR
LNDAQKRKRIDVATELLERNEEEPFLEYIVTGDEKWIPFKNPDHHNQWLSEGQASSSTPKKDFRQEKRLLCVFWDRRHVIHWELLEKGQTVNAALYCEQLSRLRRKMRNRQGPIVLLHDNATSHTAQLTKNKISEFGWTTLKHPPYSPDLAPSDFHLFRALEHFLRGKHFQNAEEMRLSLAQFFDSKPQEFYRRGIYQLPEKWQQVIDVDGEYFDE